MRSILVATLLCAALAGCGELSADRYERRVSETRALIERWFAALAGAEDDRGWSLLSPRAQAGFDGEEQYVALAAAAEWSGFEATIVNAYCDDLVACVVSLNVVAPGGTVPDFLAHSPNDRETDAYRLLGLDGGDGDNRLDEPDPHVGNAQVQVWWPRFAWDERGGVGGGGG